MKVKQKSVCRNCRQRKLGCDGKSPECSQCTLTGRKCPGYQQEWTFIQQNIPSTGPLRRGHLAASGSCRNTAVHGSISRKGGAPGHALDASAQFEPPSDIMSDLQSTSPSQLAQLIVKSYIPEDEIPFMSYNPDSNGCSRICGSWVEALPRLANTAGSESIFIYSMKALALAIASHQDRQDVSSLNTTRIYTTAICALRQKLAMRRQPFDAELAAAIMCLSLAEAMFPGQGPGISAHIRGVGQLMRTHGPSHYQAGLLHTLFVGFRPLLIIDAFQSRKSTFLAEKQWISIPFAFSCSSLMQDFLSEVAIIPSYLEAIDQIMSNAGKTSPDYVAELLSALLDCLSRFEAWERSLQYQHGILGSHSSLGPGAQLYFADSTILSLWFPNVTIANVSTYLWAIRIVCLKEIYRLLSTCSGFLEMNKLVEQYSLEHVQDQVLALSIRICCSLEYLMRDEMKLFGPASIFFPLRVAYDCFKEDRRHQGESLRFCEHIVDRLVSKGLRSIPGVIFSR